MASLQARSSLRSAQSMFFLNKVVSFSAFIVLLCVGWVALSYLKSDVFNRGRNSASMSPTSKAAVVQVADASSTEVKQVAVPARLVYSCASDKDHYHASTHLPSRCDRTALSEEAAIGRGLSRCKACFPD